MPILLAHAFGARYELPLPLWLFIIGGGLVVLISFLIIERLSSPKASKTLQIDETPETKLSPIWTTLSFIILGLLIICGIKGSQVVAENILPTVFWLFTWIAVPLSVGILGDWTKPVNPMRAIAILADNAKLRAKLLKQKQPLKWPEALGWWPAVVLFFVLACGELVFNQTATLPAVTAYGLLIYFIFSGIMGLLFGKEWLNKGEVFTVLYGSWGRLGYFRFDSPGHKGFAGGLEAGFFSSPSRLVFVLLMLLSVNFDGLISTPSWNHLKLQAPSALNSTPLRLELFSLATFIGLVIVIGAVFLAFATAAQRLAKKKTTGSAALAPLLPSLLPIAFGYLLAHNIEYLVVNGQLTLPLLGNPAGIATWPIHLPHPFNDSYEVHTHLLPSAFYWYFSAIVIVLVHIVAVWIAHRYLSNLSRDKQLSKKAQYPWLIAMVAYTMLSLWLLAQPLVKEKPKTSLNQPKNMVAILSAEQP